MTLLAPRSISPRGSLRAYAATDTAANDAADATARSAADAAANSTADAATYVHSAGLRRRLPQPTPQPDTSPTLARVGLCVRVHELRVPVGMVPCAQLVVHRCQAALRA